jgi:molybdopterin synthase sulfur carrier subunit
MPRVNFTKHLVRYFPSLRDGDFEGSSVAEVIASVAKAHPGIESYILDDRGSLRHHVNIFVGDELIHDRERLSDRVPAGVAVSVFQSLSGG